MAPFSFLKKASRRVFEAYSSALGFWSHAACTTSLSLRSVCEAWRSNNPFLRTAASVRGLSSSWFINRYAWLLASMALKQNNLSASSDLSAYDREGAWWCTAPSTSSRSVFAFFLFIFVRERGKVGKSGVVGRVESEVKGGETTT